MYAASYGHVNIVKELIGRGANISLQNKKGQDFLIDITWAKRDEFEWRDELAYFVEQTEDELTRPNFCRMASEDLLVESCISPDPNHDIAMRL